MEVRGVYEMAYFEFDVFVLSDIFGCMTITYLRNNISLQERCVENIAKRLGICFNSVIITHLLG